MPALDLLVLGTGAREHALAWRLARDESVGRVSIAPGNGGTAACGRNITDLDILDPAAVARHAARERYGLVVVGPEAPLAAGVADALEQARVPVFGPGRQAGASRIVEGVRQGADGPCRRADRSRRHLPRRGGGRGSRAPGRSAARRQGRLAGGGKGVVVPETDEEAELAIRSLFDGAAPGATLILEERLEGREVSAFALVSGEAVVPVGAACDYKRLGDGDVGPNTGGMGSYAPVPWFGAAQMEEAVATIFEPIAWRMARDGIPYRGVLYAGLMLTAAGPMVLEFNARFGDPEAQVLLPMLDGDLSAALLGAAIGDRTLMEDALGWRAGAAVGVVLASGGYPDRPSGGSDLGAADPSGPGDDGPLLSFHGATRRRVDGGYETTGGRVVTFVGRGNDLATAREAAYRGIDGAALEGAQHRSDIGLRELG